MEDKSLYEYIRKIIAMETKFHRTYLGQVQDTNDELKNGRVLVTIPELGWFTNDQGLWAAATDKKSMIVPKLMDWVVIFFMNGNPDRPYYIGVAGEIDGMKPKNYDQPTTKVIFESNDQDVYIKYDETAKKLSIEDSHSNKIETDTNGVKVTDKNTNKIEMTSTGIKMTDKNNNTIEMTSGEVKINGTNLEVMYP